MDDRPIDKRFSLAFYFGTLKSVLVGPGEFFESLPEPQGLQKPFAFLLVSSLLHAALGWLLIPSFWWAMVMLTNALISPMIAAAAGYGLIRGVTRQQVPFNEVFALYGYAIGTTHLISWIPMANWIAEPWWWVLIGTGMVRRFRISGFQALFIIGFSIVLIRVFFSILTPLTLEIKSWFVS
jgi:hypothetical protein